MPICRVIRFPLQGCKSIRIAELISYKCCCISHMSSLVISMKLLLRRKVKLMVEDESFDTLVTLYDTIIDLFS